MFAAGGEKFRRGGGEPLREFLIRSAGQTVEATHFIELRHALIHLSTLLSLPRRLLARGPYRLPIRLAKGRGKKRARLREARPLPWHHTNSIFSSSQHVRSFASSARHLTGVRSGS